MWPGQQPGGEQQPQAQNQYQQPAPYGSQGEQQPQQYQQQWGQPQGQWGQPMPPGAPQPAKSGTKPSTAIAIVGAVAVIAAAAVTGVVLLNEEDDGGSPSPKAAGTGSASPSPSPEPSSPAAQEDPENPRGGGTAEIEPVVEGWKAVYNPKRHNVYDVPPEWEVQDPGTSIGFESKEGEVLVSMTGAALYKDGICKYASRAGAGTKGGIGAKNTSEAAENEAGAWAAAAYNTSGKATIKQTPPEPFTSKHGLKGHMATATATGVPQENKCSADGKTVAFTYTDVNGEFATWVLYSDAGVKDEVPDATIAKIMDSLRPLEE